MENRDSAFVPPEGNYVSQRYLILCLILITIGFRIVRLDADPPANFCWSGGYFADEGYWSHNARNAVLFGNPRMDGWDARIVSPLFAYFQQFIFSLFGVGLRQVRSIGILSGVIIALVTFFFFRKQFDPSVSFLAAVLVSISYPLLVLARQGIIDPFSTALGWGALLMAMNRSRLFTFLAGVLLTAACITKYLMIYALLPIAFVFLVLKPGRQALVGFTVGALLSFGLWLVLNYIPNRELLQSFSGYYSSQQSRQSWELVPLFSNLVNQPFYLYFLKTPVILFSGNLMLWYLLIRWKQAGPVEKACVVWLITGVVFFAFWRYRPFRYYTSLIPPLAGLAGVSLLRLAGINEALQDGRQRPFLYFGMLIPVLQALFVLFDLLSGSRFIPPEVGIQPFDVIIFLAVSCCVPLLLLNPAAKIKWIMILLSAGFLLSDLRNYLSWMIKPQYAAVEISHDLAARIDKGIITGQWAPELVLENQHRAVPVWKDFVNSDEPFEKFGITHMLLWRYPLGDEVEKFKSWYPEDFKKFQPVIRYTIKDSELVLYERSGVRKE